MRCWKQPDQIIECVPRGVGSNRVGWGHGNGHHGKLRNRIELRLGHSGSATLGVEAAGTTSQLINESITLNPSTSYTVLAGNYSSAINATILTDDNTTPTSGNVSIRIVNASPALGTADVYVLAPGSSLSSATATVSNLNFESASSYQSLSAGTYEVYLTQPGQKSAIIDSGPLTLTSQQIRTVVSLDGQSGGYETAVLSDLN